MGLTPAQIERLNHDTDMLLKKIDLVCGAVVDDLKRTSAYIKHRLDMDEARISRLEEQSK